LDIIESDLFALHLQNISWLRLDGSIESSRRGAIVSKFNTDPTIDVLLLTTRVGGLGLNLTSADTVIFMSHDWNPSADLQAMDRAHRIGQTKCVNVYRLITRGTIEDKIMNLQQFKMNISRAVVNRENTSFKSLDPDSLNSFVKPEEKKKKKNDDDLWEEEQYGFDMESYLKNE
jgi:TATA-binding protein-associated factor